MTEEELRKKCYYYGRSSSSEFVRKDDSGELIDGEFERVESDQARIGHTERVDPATACDFQIGLEGVRGPKGECGPEGVRGPEIDPEFLASLMAQVEAARPKETERKRSLGPKQIILFALPLIPMIIVLLTEYFK